MATLTAPPVTFAREVPGGIENLRFPERSPLCARFTDHTHIECSPFELKGVPKPKYWFRDIGTSDQPLRWVNINAPTEQVLCNVAKTIGVSNGTMELILRDETYNKIPLLDTARIHVEQAVTQLLS